MDREKMKLEANIKPPPGTEKNAERKKWEKPTLEDVSGKVMAQPYIRFT